MTVNPVTQSAFEGCPQRSTLVLAISVGVAIVAVAIAIAITITDEEKIMVTVERSDNQQKVLKLKAEIK